MAALFKKIKTFSVATAKQEILPGEEHRLPGWGLTLMTDDIWIVGWQLTIVADGWPDAPVVGELDCTALLGRVASIDGKDNFGMARVHVSLFALTVGDDEALGPKIDTTSIVLPAGTGIMMEEGEPVYISAYLAMRGMMALDLFAYATLYYVEA